MTSDTARANAGERLTEKEALIARRAKIKNLADDFQNKCVEHDADAGLVLDAALMLVRGVSKQLPSPEHRLHLLNSIQECLVDCVAMNSQVMVAAPAAGPLQ